MNILFIHHRYHTNLFNWFRGFQQNGHKVRLLVYKPDEVDVSDLPKSDYLLPAQRSFRMMQKNPRTRGDGVDSFSPYYYPSFRTLYQYFKKEKPDVVVIRPVFSRFGYLALFMALWFRSRIVFHSRIRIHRHYSKFKLIIFRLFMGLLNAYWMSPCKGEPDKYPLASKRLIYFPFLIEPQVKNRSYFQNDKVNILCVAKYFRSKNPMMMLEVFLKLREQFEDIKLTICGTGDPQGEYYLKMKEIINNSGFGKDIALLINQPLENMTNLYKDHDIFVLPTRHDPASFTVLEAMSFGLAVITTRVDGSSGYVIENENGFIVSEKDIEDLLSKLRVLISSRSQVKNYGQNSLHRVRKFHQQLSQVKKFISRVYT